MSDTFDFEINEESFELKYNFKMVRKLRSEGINVPAIHRAIDRDRDCAGDYADEFTSMAAILLRDAGAKVTEQDMWLSCSNDPDAMMAVMQLFWWVVKNHYAGPQSVKKYTVKKI